MSADIQVNRPKREFKDQPSVLISPEGPIPKRTRTNSQSCEHNETRIFSRDTDDDTDSATRKPLPLPDTGNDPDDYLAVLLKAIHPKSQKLQIQPASTLENFFSTTTEEQMARYSSNILLMARANDVTSMRAFYEANGKESLDCFNRFGEGLLNLACRRGFVDMVKFLLETVQLDVRVRDDYGRTPLHDACWASEPQLEICSLILRKDPCLFLIADKRGHTPFQYARQSDWSTWRQFLYDNSQLLSPLCDSDVVSRFGVTL